MSDCVEAIFVSVIAVALFALGWVVSASTIGHECKKLGGFYVSDTVYECKLKEKNT